MNERYLPLIFGLILLTGCAITPPMGQCAWNDWGVFVCNNYMMEFISEPSGAKIEVDNNYIGNAPVSLRFDGVYGVHTYIVKAYPTQPGQFVQTKMLSVDNLPKRVYFDMNLGPVTPSIDVNVNN